jgi:hypothetical protein
VEDIVGDGDGDGDRKLDKVQARVNVETDDGCLLTSLLVREFLPVGTGIVKGGDKMCQMAA